MEQFSDRSRIVIYSIDVTNNRTPVKSANLPAIPYKTEHRRSSAEVNNVCCFYLGKNRLESFLVSRGVRRAMPLPGGGIEWIPGRIRPSVALLPDRYQPSVLAVSTVWPIFERSRTGLHPKLVPLQRKMATESVTTQAETRTPSCD